MRKSQTLSLTSKNGQHFNGASLMSPLEALIGKEKLTSIAAGFNLRAVIIPVKPSSFVVEDSEADPGGGLRGLQPPL